MFFLISIRHSLNDFTVKLGHNIQSVRYCAEEDMNYTLLSPWHHDFVIALTEYTNETKLSYAQPIGTEHHPYDFTLPAYRFPTGNAEINIELKKDHCVGFSYASILRSSCMSNLIVYVNETFNHHWDTSIRNADECIFFAPPAKHKLFKLDCNMANDKVLIYRDNMVHNQFDDSFEGKAIADYKIAYSSPIIFRLQTMHDSEPGYANITGYSKEPMKNQLNYYGPVVTVKPEDIKVLRIMGVHYYALPILGCAPSALLLTVWIYAFLSIMRKKPQDKTENQTPIP
ncbi:hypothetical protein TVAG_473390 [Trichomonas vaginalis G3]|uniref:Uncharacterized protein n=1 Tax=Trichomonas vaginalis (strain ATCC PRA-98 / G3) TaxID=412133 RepID=A2EUF6_TRIV3|nr:hypothetical protein TVAGG3_0317190 [Trichomonas vaginalis G3]EAY03715.1 hypothetical protein TVAG_473390 [Trichomonas vaginalis G3]KAI5529021.1 hypothetical protein TVAGG3_0317190 [Trichomonas vaginalis G3]|eukprot:XP_001315938.1 hypothetical protein [Trichomonas vaginalis G3]